MKINKVEIKQLDPIKTIAITHLGDYAGIADAFKRLAEWADINNLWSAAPKMAGVYHNDPRHTPIEKLRSEACLQDISGVEPAEGMMRYTISGGKYFVMQVEVTMAEYGEAWRQAYTAVAEQGYECDTCDHYELYVSCVGSVQDPNAPWIVDLCIPVK